MSQTEDRETEHPIYASGGMAAAGMIPKSRAFGYATPLTYGVNPVEEEPVEVTVTGEEPPELSEDLQTVSEEVEPVAEEEPALEEIEPESEVEETVAEIEPVADEAVVEPVSEEVEEEQPSAPTEEAEPDEEVIAEESPEELEPIEEIVAEETVDAPVVEETVTEEESESFIEEIYVGETEAPTEPVPAHLHIRETESGPRPRTLAVLGSESKEELAAIFSAVDGIDVIAPEQYDDPGDFVDYQKPDLALIMTPDASDHFELSRRSLEAGAHVFCAAPFAATLKEADKLVALADEKGLVLSVGNAIACYPLVRVAILDRPSLIGDLLEIRVIGEMGVRAGGEDLLMQGSQLFDLVRAFGGDVSWCSADITCDGERALPEHIFNSGSPGLGPIVGDRIYAQFRLQSGVHVSFISDSRAGAAHGPTGLELIGSKSIMRISAPEESAPHVHLLQNPSARMQGESENWIDWTPDGVNLSNSSPLDDWLSAIVNERTPICSGMNALKALEMVHGVWQSGIAGRRTYFPLVNRLHPLGDESLS